MKRFIPCVGLAVALASFSTPLHAQSLFGMQSIPKFDEGKKEGSWGGTRERGLQMHRDLGVQLSREGMIWMHYEPEPGKCPWQDDFDDAVERLDSSGIRIEEMITDTPFWASTHPRKNPQDPSSFKNAPPVGLSEPIFADGTDTGGPEKQINPRNVWAVFLDCMTRRYRGKIDYYQIWNEPDFPSGATGLDYRPERTWQGSVGQYVRLLKIGHCVIKRNDPNALVVTGGLGYSSYLEAMLERGAGAYFDVLDFHAYGSPGSDRGIKEFLKVHAAMRDTLRRHGLRKRMLCSETGYTADEPEEQADYIWKVYATSLALGLEGTCYYTNTNPSWSNMGLVDWATMERKTQGYEAYRRASRALGTACFVGKVGTRPEIVAYRFERSGKPLIVAWAPFREKPLPWKIPAGRWKATDSTGRTHPAGRMLPLGKRAVILESL